MKHKTKLIVSVAALAILLFASIAGVVFAQTSANFEAVWSRIAGGGGERRSENYLVQDILGQWVSQSPASTNAQVITNFFAPNAHARLYLPVVARP